jgi:hypothetical protein
MRSASSAYIVVCKADVKVSCMGFGSGRRVYVNPSTRG